MLCTNVTFHGIQFPREGFMIVVSLILLGHIKMWRVRLSWDSRVTCSRVSRRALYLRIVLGDIRSKNPYITTHVVAESEVKVFVIKHNENSIGSW